MWPSKRRRRSDDFPREFKVQRIGIATAKAIAYLPPSTIAKHLGKNPDVAKALLLESEDKRGAPSTFITFQNGEFQVGWLSSRQKTECLRRFPDLADAATDYLLFSRGKGRWAPPQAADPKPVSN